MSASITILVVPADDPEAFVQLDLEERRRGGMGWETFPLGCGRFLDAFVMKATGVDLGVLRLDEEEDLTTCLIERDTLVEVLPDLEALVASAETVPALCRRGGDRAAPERVAAALATGAWPDSGDPAEEAAAFARRLLLAARTARAFRMGVCWEYRGDVRPV